jgi:hypothetical protein
MSADSIIESMSNITITPIPEPVKQRTRPKVSEEPMSIDHFWDKIEKQNKDKFKTMMKYLLEEYGTGLHCNRFTIGNCHEYAIEDLINDTGLKAKINQNEKRTDIYIEGFRNISIKYSSTGAIKLHNSNNCSNSDMSMVDTILVTPTEWWFLAPEEIEKVGISLTDYLENTGDGLQLLRKILKELKNKNYPYKFECVIGADKTKCKNNEIARPFYEIVKSKLGLE